MKTTTLLINGIKTNFNYKKLLQAWNNDDFEIKDIKTRYVSTSFGKAELNHLHDKKMFRLIYTKYDDIKYIKETI